MLLHFRLRAILLTLVGALVATIIPAATHAAGVTLITHGFEFNNEYPTWVDTMASAIASKAGQSTPIVEIVVSQANGPLYISRFRRDNTGVLPSEISTNSEIVVKLLWNTVAGLNDTGVTTQAIAQQVLPYFLEIKTLDDGTRMRPFAELPIHLIGHSRGGSVVTQIAGRCSEQGLWVDHLTLLDPHPESGPIHPDAPIALYSGVLFADNYWENDGDDLDPNGQFVEGAYNRRLPVSILSQGGYGRSGIFDGDHSDVHLWYHGTIDPTTPLSDGSATIDNSMRLAWWDSSENRGANTGYFFSRIVGGKRPESGISTAFQGKGERVTPANLATEPWPNVMIVIDGDGQGLIGGQPTRISYWYATVNNNSTTITFGTDNDRNPYNGFLGSDIPDVNLQKDTTRLTLRSSFVWTPNAEYNGRFLFAKISDGKHTRYYYLQKPLQIAPIPPPNLYASVIVKTGGGRSGRDLVNEKDTFGYGEQGGLFGALSINDLSEEVKAHLNIKKPDGTIGFTYDWNPVLPGDRWLWYGWDVVPNLDQDGSWTFEWSLDRLGDDKGFILVATAPFNYHRPDIIFEITASAGSNGSITPSGSFNKLQGETQTFSAVPSAGYGVDQWLVDGNLVQREGISYTLPDIHAKHTVSVTFKFVGDGTVQFNNRIVGSVDARVFLPDGKTGIGTGFTAQLYAGPEGTAVSALKAVTPKTDFRTTTAAAAGYVNPVDVTIPGIAGGSKATIVMRVYNGATYENSSVRGESNPITIALGGGSSGPPASLVGLQSFTVGLGGCQRPVCDDVQTVNGFQDSFDSPTRDPHWVAFGPGGDLYQQSGGVLHVRVSSGDPNHLLYVAPGYSSDVQEVLARIRVTAFGIGDSFRAGLGVGVNPTSDINSTNFSRGLNLLFRDFTQDNVPSRQFKFLDDRRTWGPPGLRTTPGQATPGWELNTWYWMRLRLDTQTGGNNYLFGKVWLADGVAYEPTDWQMTWGGSDIPSIPKPLRTGFAGITGSSSNGAAEFDVDYILIKAAGLPQIKVKIGGTGGGGTVQFNNRIIGSVDVRVFLLDGKTGVGAGWTAQLYAGPEGTPVDKLIPVNPTTDFRTTTAAAAGYVNPVDVTIPGIAGGSKATIVMRVYNGATYENSSVRGESNPITIALGGGSSGPPASLVGLQSFTVSKAQNDNGNVIFQDSGGFLAAWMMNGSSLSSAKFLSPSNVGDLAYRVAASGDFNGDNKDDLVFQHADGTLAVWFMNGTSQIGSALLSPSNPGDKNWRVVGKGDINRDGKLDLVFQHTDGTLAVWYMDGVKLSSSALLSPSSPGDPGWRVVGIGDFDADGQQDLVFQHNDGTLAVWFLTLVTPSISGQPLIPKMKLASVFSPSNPGLGWRVVSVVDRDNDGKPDLLFQHSNLDLAIWYMDGVRSSSFRLLDPRNPGGAWKVVGPK